MFYAGSPVHSEKWCREKGDDLENPPVGIAEETILLTISDDLWDWKIQSNDPISEPITGYKKLKDDFGYYGFRDPHIIFHPGIGYLLYYVCALNDNEDAKLNSISVATSSDLIHWKDKGPVLLRYNPGFEEHRYSRQEPSCVIHRNGV